MIKQLFWLLLTVSVAAAEDELPSFAIIGFHTDIEVRENTSLLVKETITIRHLEEHSGSIEFSLEKMVKDQEELVYSHPT